MERQDRYMRDPIGIRLGGIAANLARVSSISNNPASFDAAFGLMEESKYFIEWTAPDSEMETTTALADLQRTLTRWQRNLSSDWQDGRKRANIGKEAKSLSEMVLQRSGLLDRK